ncbi:hypothetical protein GWK47_027900 [Chionoecetes opilio]|uniref:Uncharacterized protein n=1 Tax=Chionoecetes opilio TaxID=41210 RepID=A0A8J4YTF2_CHIOP|nr:hypothetical protein GWK47_027900 [Chionoecetes opilio]
MLCLTSTRRHHQRCRTSQQKWEAQGSISRENSTWGQLQHGESSRSSSNKGKSHQVPVEELKNHSTGRSSRAKGLYVTCEQLCFKITKEQWEEAPELKSSQEEADTRLLLHALHAAESGCKSVIIPCRGYRRHGPCLGDVPQDPIPPVPKCGTKNRTRFLDITTLGPYTGRQRV